MLNVLAFFPFTFVNPIVYADVYLLMEMVLPPQLLYCSDKRELEQIEEDMILYLYKAYLILPLLWRRPNKMQIVGNQN